MKKPPYLCIVKRCEQRQNLKNARPRKKDQQRAINRSPILARFAEGQNQEQQKVKQTK